MSSESINNTLRKVDEQCEECLDAPHRCNKCSVTNIYKDIVSRVGIENINYKFKHFPFYLIDIAKLDLC